MKIAIIDIGSNSVKLSIYEDDNLIVKRSITTRLANGISGNILKTASINTTVEAIFTFINEAKDCCCDEVLAYGTEALRSAKNANELTDRVLSISQVKVDIISSELEAKIGFIGATRNAIENSENKAIKKLNKFTKTTYGEATVVSELEENEASRTYIKSSNPMPTDLSDCFAFVDIGGASLEIAIGNKDKMLLAKSFPLGAVTLKQCCEDDKKKIAQAFYSNVSEEFISEFNALADKSFGKKCGTLYSCCGSAKAIAFSFAYGTEERYPQIITLERLEEFNEKIENLPVELRKQALNLHKDRADIIYGASVIFEKVLNSLSIKSITVTDGDASYGYLLHCQTK